MRRLLLPARRFTWAAAYHNDAHDHQAGEADSRTHESHAWESLQADDEVSRAKECLGLDEDTELGTVTDASLKRHYWRMARRVHPDTATGDRYRFVELQAALDVLRQEVKMQRHREEQLQKRRKMEEFNERLRRATVEANAEEFRKLCAKIKAQKDERTLQMDATTLFRVLDGANLLYALENPSHVTYCAMMIESWEDATGRRAPRDVYHSIMWNYCTSCEDSLCIHRAMTVLMSAMARNGIDLTDQSIQMVRQMVRRAGRMGTLGGEGSALRM